jgi:hypothetical protein
VEALRGETVKSDTYNRTLTDSGSFSSEFSLTRNLDSARQFKVAHEFEDSGSHHKIWLDSVTPSTLQPRYNISDFHLFGALKNAVRITRFETDDVICAVKTWLRELRTDNAYTLVSRWRKAA